MNPTWQFALIVLYSVTALADAAGVAQATLAVDVHPQSVALARAMSDAEQEKFNDEIVRGFVRAGFAQVDLRWCVASGCRGDASASHLHLDINIGEVYRGQQKRGIFFDFGAADSRSTEGYKRDLLPVSCRLRTPAGRLLAARDDDLQLPSDVVAGDAVDGGYLAAKLNDVCRPVLHEQALVVLAPAAESTLLTTTAPGVFIEKREVARAVPVAPASAEAGVMMPTAALPAVGLEQSVSSAAPLATRAVTNAKTKVTRQSDGKRTQYVLHNQGDTVYFEFGQHERGQ